jgi:lysophospholipase L1-like esterase
MSHRRPLIPLTFAGIVAVLVLCACGRETKTGPLLDSDRVAGRSGVSPTDDALVHGRTSSSSSPQAVAQDFPFRRVLCFGDSLTFGTTLVALDGAAVLAPVEGYVPKLARLVRAAHPTGEFEFINAGIGAEATSEGRERLSRQLRRFEPDLVLLLEGAVDVGSRNPPYAQIRQNLAAMMRDVLGRRVDLIVGTVPPFHPDGFRASPAIENVPRLNEIIRDEAEAIGVVLADHALAFGDNPGLQGPDGVHPNDNGYELMAATWFAALEELLARGT